MSTCFSNKATKVFLSLLLSTLVLCGVALTVWLFAFKSGQSSGVAALEGEGSSGWFVTGHMTSGWFVTGHVTSGWFVTGHVTWPS